MARVCIRASRCTGSVSVPSSKSDAHRKIIAAGLAFGEVSRIERFVLSDDLRYTLEAMRAFADIVVSDRHIEMHPRIPERKEACFDAGESGSTLRFLMPLFARFFATTRIEARKSLRTRPLEPYREIFKDRLEIGEEIVLKGGLSGGDYRISGNLSSQFVSGLLFALPLIETDSTLNVSGRLESKPYVDLTLSALKEAGICIEESENAYRIRGNQRYRGCDYCVEGDYSQLAFFAVLGQINAPIHVKIAPKKTCQGDARILTMLRAFHGRFLEDETGYTFLPSSLKAAEIDLADQPDLGPILFVLALFAEGTSRFVNVRRLRYKECDRIEAMKSELKKFGAEISVGENEVLIAGQKVHSPDQIVDAHNDHRILMALSILATVTKETTLEDSRCVNKSYPGFFRDLKKIGIEVNVLD